MKELILIAKDKYKLLMDTKQLEKSDSYTQTESQQEEKNENNVSKVNSNYINNNQQDDNGELSQTNIKLDNTLKLVRARRGFSLKKKETAEERQK